MYANSQCAVKANVWLSNKFSIRSGVRQSCALLPLLFITYAHQIFKVSSTNQEENLSDQQVISFFGDDQAIISTSEEHI